MNQKKDFQMPDSVEDFKNLIESGDLAQILSILRAQLEIDDESRFNIDSLNRILSFYRTWRPRPGQMGSQLESMAVSWADTAFMNGRAAIWALENGMNHVSAGCARVALEHGLYISVLANEGEPEGLMDAREARVLRDFELAMNEAGVAELLTPLTDLVTEYGEPVSGSREASWANRVKMMTAKVETGDLIYSMYRLLSFQVHPTHFNALTFMANPNSEPLPYAPSSMVSLCALAGCMWSGWSLERLLGLTGFSELADTIAPNTVVVRLRKSGDLAG